MADSADSSFVIFRLGDEEYGMSVASVNSIIRYEEPTPVPRAPAAVLGVINLRGKVVPVVDLYKRFKGAPFTPGPQSRIVVAEGVVGAVGLVVDSASEVTSIDIATLQPVPDGVLGVETARAFRGVFERAGSLVILIDLDEALPRAEYASAISGDEGAGE